MTNLFKNAPAKMRRGLATVCLAMLLVASFVQVMHHCTALEFEATHQATGEALTSSPVFCNVCMTVQVAAMAVVVLVLAVGRVRSFAPALPILLPPESSPAFSLYVRPPPALSF